VIRHRRASRIRRGFTLVEAIATITVLSVVASVSSGVVLQAADGYMEVATRAQIHAEASIAMDRIMRELRKVPLDSGAAGIAPNIDQIFPTYMDWGGNTDGLSMSGTDLQLKVNSGANETLLTDVTSFELRPYNESNAFIGPSLSGTGCDPIRRIEVNITVTRYGVATTLRSRMYLRATMDDAS
jgi:prepilin-type N-terminal cleavage/methylation domain-containing protein